MSERDWPIHDCKELHAHNLETKRGECQYHLLLEIANILSSDSRWYLRDGQNLFERIIFCPWCGIKLDGRKGILGVDRAYRGPLEEPKGE